jgi:CRISPR/Cas system CSM-associated protein Csm2 small subunit
MEKDLNNTTLLESLEDLVDQLGMDKITEEEVINVLESIVKYQKFWGEVCRNGKPMVECECC